MPDYGEAFKLWRTRTQQAEGKLWHAYTHHEFVQGLLDGSLPRQAFVHYLIQDYLFLVHFSRAWAFAVVKSETLQEMKLASSTVNALVNHEMRHHVKVCAEHGIDEAALFNAREENANLAYTRYVMDAGLSGDLVDLLATLSPCVMGYGEIGARLAKEASNTTYQDWINTYACDEYQQLCQNVGELLDKALSLRIGSDFEKSPRWERLCKRFIIATRLEVGFWDMGLNNCKV